MTKPQKITTEIILADYIPAPARTPEISRQIEAAIRADNQAALEKIVLRTQQAFAIQQQQIDQIANYQQAQSYELSQIRQQLQGLNQSQPQPQIVYNISDNRTLYHQTNNYSNSWNYTDNQTTTYNNSWNAYTDNSNRSLTYNQTNNYTNSWNSHTDNSNRSLTYNQNRNYRNCWNDNSDNSRHTEDNSTRGIIGDLWPLFAILLFLTLTAICSNSRQSTQNPQQIERAR